jgi:DNA-binding transcriptional LysR family regulator
MDFTQLKYFQVIARTGNISKAAQELFVTQPNLSKSIARLEGELGVPLFDHRRGKIVLNEYGRVFLNSVILSFSELTKGIQSIQRLYDTSQNVLSLGCSIDDFLPYVLKDFSLIHPEIGIRQFSCEPDELARRLHRRSIDIAVVPYPIQDKLLVYQELGRKDFVILIWDGHPLSGRRSVAISELVEERFVCDRSRMDKDMLRNICNARGFEPIIAFEMESTDLIYRLVEGKAGIAFMPMAQLTKMHRENPEHNGLRLLYIEDDLPPAQLGLLFHKDYVFSAAATCLRNFLIDWLRREDELLCQLGYINRTI